MTTTSVETVGSTASQTTSSAVLTAAVSDGTGTTAGAGVGGELPPALHLPDLQFSIPDYVVFAISLALPLAIGVFFFFYKRKEQSAANFLVGDRSMNFLAVSLSITASLLNGTFIIGIPTEMHYYGIEFVYIYFGLVIGVLLTAFLFIPKFHSMNFNSAYEYVERRFNYATRVIASILFGASMIVFMAVVLYVPALSFAQVTSLHIYVTIAVTGAICTIYTALGGLRAVVWTDALQMLIMLIGLIALAALGSQNLGGGNEVWRIAMENGRVNLNNFNPHPFVRHSFWTQTIGVGFLEVGLLSSNQMIIQRYMSVSSVWKAQWSMILALVYLLPLIILVLFIGLAMYAEFAACDPLVTGQIKSPDQILPYYILHVLGGYQGVPGLLIAAVFAASLSSVSSVINSLATVCLEDFMTPAAIYLKGSDLADKIRQRIAICLVTFFGLLTIALSFAAHHFTTKLVEATGIIWGVIGGPLGGLFIMGFFIPCCNSAGAISGMIGSLALALWISIGYIMYVPYDATLPVGVCIPNISVPLVTNTSMVNWDDPLMNFYRVSYAWYALIAIVACVIIGVVVSAITGGCRRSYTDKLDPSVIHLECCCCSCCRYPRSTPMQFELEKVSGEQLTENVMVVGYQSYDNETFAEDDEKDNICDE